MRGEVRDGSFLKKSSHAAPRPGLDGGGDEAGERVRHGVHVVELRGSEVEREEMAGEGGVAEYARFLAGSSGLMFLSGLAWVDTKTPQNLAAATFMGRLGGLV